MAARLALAGGSFGIAVILDAMEASAFFERRGFYGTIALTFVATIFYGVALPRASHPRRFAALNIATDIGFVSLLVYFSGGGASVFSFLYVAVVVYGALLFERPGAIAVACAAALAYGVVLLASDSAQAEESVSVTGWLVHAGAMLLVASLASFLAAELRRTGEALDQRTSDLLRLRSLYQRTVESLMSGLLTTDRSGRVTSFNPEAERITGLGAAEALGRGVDEVLPGVRELVIAAAANQSGVRSRARMPFRSCDGRDLHLGVAAYILRDGSQASGHVVIFQDVTAVVEMEQELRRSERLAAVGELSASMAHEIRNPLAAISGAIQMLRALGGSSAGEAERLMAIVLRETDRLDRLITDFLHYARPAPVKLVPVTVSRVVEEVLEGFAASPPAGVSVDVALEPDLVLFADASQLSQVLWNLVLNAAQAMPEGGRLRISGGGAASQEAPPGRRKDGGEEASWAEIAVHDDGVGIPPEVRDRIFDPFFTTKRGGTGLGLATVHRIVENHGGSVRLESSPGCGTTVRVRFPRAEAA